MTQLKYEEDHSPMQIETLSNAQVSPTSPQADLAFRNNERRGLCGPTPSNSDTAFELEQRSEDRFCPSNGSARLGAATDTAHLDCKEKIRMPVDEPLPDARRAFHKGVEHEFLDEDGTWNADADPREMNEWEDCELDSHKPYDSDPIKENHLVDAPAPRNGANHTTRSGERLRIAAESTLPPHPGAQQDFHTPVDQRRERMDGHQAQSVEPSAAGTPQVTFFDGAFNVTITGDFNIHNYGNVRTTVFRAPANTNATNTASRGSGNEHGWFQASTNVNLNTGTRSYRAPHVGHYVEINLGNDWPFGANSTPPSPRNRLQSSSLAVGSNPTDFRHIDGKDDRDGYAPTPPDGSDGPVEENTFASYGGDRYGNGMSNFVMSGTDVLVSDKGLVKLDVGTLKPYKHQGDHVS